MSITESEILAAGPVCLFAFALVQVVGGTEFVIYARERPRLLIFAKFVVYAGLVIGFVGFAKVLQSAANVTTTIFSHRWEQLIFPITMPLISYYVSALLIGISYTAIAPNRWRMYMDAWRSKLTES